MGTTWRVTVVGEIPDKAAIQKLLDDLESRWSHYRDDSEISRFNQSASTNWFPVSADTASLVADSLKLSAKTSGAFDITVAPWVNTWGFGPGHSDTSGATIQPTQTGYRHLHIRPAPPALRKDVRNLALDLSAIAKGKAVDLLADWLEQQGHTNALVDIGGELKAVGHSASGRPWRVGVREPGGTGLQAIVELPNLAIATSGTDRNRKVINGKPVSHIIDPATGQPIGPAIFTVSVIHESCATADALATALIVMGPERGLAWAKEKDLAVAFFVKEGDQVLERMTDGFAKLVREPR